MNDNNNTTMNPTETVSTSSSFVLVERKSPSEVPVTVSHFPSSLIPSAEQSSCSLYPLLDDISPIWSFLLCLSGLRYSPNYHKVIQWCRRTTFTNNNTIINTKSSHEMIHIRHITESRVYCLSYYTIYSYCIHAIFIGVVMGLHAINADYKQVIAGVPGMVAWILLRSIFNAQEQTSTPTFEHSLSDPSAATSLQQYYSTHTTRLYTRIRYIIYVFNALMLAIALALIVFFGIVAQRWSISTLIWNIYTITLVGVGYIYFLIILVILKQQTNTLLYYFQTIPKDQHYVQHMHNTYQACHDYVDRTGKIWSLPVAAACLLFIWAFIFGVREYLVKGSYGGLPWLLLAPFMFVSLVGPILWLNLSSSESALTRATLSLMLTHSIYTNVDVVHGCHMFLQSMIASPIQLTICGITPTAALVATSVAGPIVALLWNSGQAFVTSE